MRFLFYLDLSLHKNTGKKIGILNLGTKHGIKRIVDTLRASICTPTQATSGQIFKLLCESIISVLTPMIRCDSFSPLMANRWEQPKLGHHRRHRRRNQDLVHKVHAACICLSQKKPSMIRVKHSQQVGSMSIRLIGQDLQYSYYVLYMYYVIIFCHLGEVLLDFGGYLSNLASILDQI